jgi:hypothetical protein
MDISSAKNLGDFEVRAISEVSWATKLLPSSGLLHMLAPLLSTLSMLLACQSTSHFSGISSMSSCKETMPGHLTSYSHCLMVVLFCHTWIFLPSTWHTVYSKTLFLSYLINCVCLPWGQGWHLFSVAPEPRPGNSTWFLEGTHRVLIEKEKEEGMREEKGVHNTSIWAVHCYQTEGTGGV